MRILIETYQRLLAETKDIYIRQFYKNFQMPNRLVGIIGARGVGKTTFLLHYLKKNYDHSDQALYVSADNLYFTEHSLLELADQFHKEYNGQLICIDEIHKYRNWNQELKNVYDSYPKMKIIFSGSSSLDLMRGHYDLSRRVILKNIYGFSFREFLEVKSGNKLPILKYEDVVLHTSSLSKQFSQLPKLIGYFKEYFQMGYYPIFLELKDKGAYLQSLMGIINKTIFEDISSFYSLKTDNLEVFRKIIYFIATSAPGKININKLAKSIKKDNATIADYLEMLRASGLLIYLMNNKKGHNLVRKAEKIYLNNTNLLQAINYNLGKEVNIGTSREIFVANQLIAAGQKIFYTETGDIECGKYKLEIGGSSKSNRQIKNTANTYLVKDDILIGDKKEIPLYLFGFLY